MTMAEPHWQEHMKSSSVLQHIGTARGQSHPRSPLTVGAGPAGLDCHHDAGFLGGGPAAHPAHVLTRVGCCHLQQPQAGARHLWGERGTLELVWDCWDLHGNL